MSRQLDIDTFARELYPGDGRATTGLYNQAGCVRVVDLDRGGSPTASLDEPAVACVSTPHSRSLEQQDGATSSSAVERFLEGLYCEVIGCSDEARWFLAQPQSANSEDYICSRHWELLKSYDPDRASQYASLLSLYNECEIHRYCDKQLA